MPSTRSSSGGQGTGTAMKASRTRKTVSRRHNPMQRPAGVKQASVNGFHTGLQKTTHKIYANNMLTCLCAKYLVQPNICVYDHKWNSTRRYLSSLMPKLIIVPEREAKDYHDMQSTESQLQRWLDRHDPTRIELFAGTFMNYLSSRPVAQTSMTSDASSSDLVQCLWMDAMAFLTTVRRDIDAAFDHPHFLDPSLCLVAVTVQLCRASGGVKLWRPQVLHCLDEAAKRKGYTSCTLLACTGDYNQTKMITCYWLLVRDD